jgi:hypothetical protein
MRLYHLIFAQVYLRFEIKLSTRQSIRFFQPDVFCEQKKLSSLDYPGYSSTLGRAGRAKKTSTRARLD